MQLVGISYDPVEVLQQFSKKNGIQFPLLSDEGSATIRAYNLLNKEASGRFEGIPHPATFLINSEGNVVMKLFEESYKQRHSADALLKAVKESFDQSK